MENVCLVIIYWLVNDLGAFENLGGHVSSALHISCIGLHHSMVSPPSIQCSSVTSRSGIVVLRWFGECLR